MEKVTVHTFSSAEHVCNQPFPISPTMKEEIDCIHWLEPEPLMGSVLLMGGAAVLGTLELAGAKVIF